MRKRILVGLVSSITGLALATSVSYGTTSVKTKLERANFNLDFPHVPGELVVKFKPSISISQTAIQSEFGATATEQVGTTGLVILKFDGFGAQSLSGKASALSKDERVEYVEANQIYSVGAIPNDEMFDKLYGMHNLGANNGTVDADIDAPEAWDLQTGSKDVLVAVIDTGIDYNHEDLAPNMWSNPGETGLDAEGRDKKTNGIDDDGNGYVDDWRGWDFVNNDNDPFDDNLHGTHCAGTIGAAGNDSVGVAGVAWSVSMVGVKFLSAAGSGTLTDAVLAIDYTTTIGVDISSNSWGGGGFSAAMEEAIARNEEAGVLFVAAAGNSGTDNDSRPHYPSSYENPNVIAVAASDNRDALAGFSCYGATSVDLAAPGVAIWSSVPDGGFRALSGTSMATPHVSGVAALVKASYPDASYEYIRDRILKGVDYSEAVTGKSVTGGRLNAYNAIENDTVAPGKVNGVELQTVGIDFVRVTWNASGDDGSEGQASTYKITAELAGSNSESSKTLTMVSTDATFSGLPLNSEGTLTVVAVDNVGNESAPSAPVAFKLVEVNIVSQNSADSMEGTTAEGDWDVVEKDGRTVITDSPNGRYENSEEAVLEFDTISVNTNQVYVGMELLYDLEVQYDFVYIEVQEAGKQGWTRLQRLNGQSDWTPVSFSLSDVLSEDSTGFNLRFRLTSDRSIAKDGIYIDNITVYAPPN